MKSPVPIEEISHHIVFIRGQRVITDQILARLYQVETRVINQAVKRNIERFPEDFVFQLTEEEFVSLRSQIVILDAGRGKYTKYLPFCFTEQGVAMLSGVLKSKTAIEVNIAIMRVFVRLRRTLESNNEKANHPPGAGLGNIVWIVILVAYAGKAAAPLRSRSRPIG